MFFVLSKILSFFLQPFIWALLLLILGVWIKKNTLKKRFYLGSLIIFLFFSNTVIFSEFTRLWEEEGVKYEYLKTYDIGIVLGGMTEFNNDLNRLSIRRGGDRVWQAIQLYKIEKIDKILISGAHGYLIDRGLNEAIQMKEDLIRMGIPGEDILTESNSKNTYQNAVESKQIIDAMEDEVSILLITSAIHMKRAKACFAKAGFTNVDVFSTDHYTGSVRGYQLDQYLIPNIGTLGNWNYLIKEWVGYVIYSLVGYT